MWHCCDPWWRGVNWLRPMPTQLEPKHRPLSLNSPNCATTPLNHTNKVRFFSNIHSVFNMDDTKSIWHQFGAAIVSGNVDEFQRVAKEHPEWPDNNGGLGYLHDISLDGVHMFKAFVEHFPQTKDWDCGHAGNPVGIAAFNNNIPLLKYVLEDLGHKANEGCFFYRPVIISPLTRECID
jgi:hypothetical protein